MPPFVRSLTAALLVACTGALAAPVAAQSQYASLPNETPAHFHAVRHDQYIRRSVDIPMRDGTKLHASIMIPKGVTRAGIVLTMTPYNAESMTHRADSPHLGPVINGYDTPADIVVEDGYIRVVVDVRGKYGSAGDFVMNRPLRGPLNHTPVDDATDIDDTVAWLVKHIPQSNGKVGIVGISYDGYEALMAMVHPNPALKVTVPINPMVDGWMGDDWFHKGAFREQMIPYIYGQEAGRRSQYPWWSGYRDDYDLYLKAGSAGALAKARGMDQLGFWRKLVQHPAYDSFWQDQAVDKLLARQPVTIPTLLVQSLWDEEDIYGAMAVYRALADKPSAKGRLFLAIGPWRHAKTWDTASDIGKIDLDMDTAKWFRQHVLRPFLAQYLKDGAPPAHVAPVTAFVTGVNHWERLSHWPEGCGGTCTPTMKPLYLHADGGLGFAPPKGGKHDSDSYVSDPAKPVPYRIRPIQPWSHGRPDQVDSWPEWLVDDQRQFATRTDVLSYETAPLKQPLMIAGRPEVHLSAATSGTDSDWVVKLIDVYPDEVRVKPSMGGYELGVAMDIFRGRYRTGYDDPQPLTPDTPLPYHFHLPTTNHVFRKGHRIMVQIQSSWFPLYDRNPQSFVKNIFLARPGDYKKATQTIYHAPGKASYIDLPVVPARSGD
ncbi:CocE/NonD family hydrolase [Oleiagrimonas sp. C23AA]|uniref:CocE/NonD family hydrolase n=1 Tax=Oleiagrimonas sp. C23AA TaxID=2719047 RepID=UPI00142465D9|nr:CocE/NonD family hydrolase [Oleiagrimonas sp. C23AA]NII10785.1 CocE/NonD family hydrolase [Oleiagrimonas sp. C23AA]